MRHASSTARRIHQPRGPALGEIRAPGRLERAQRLRAAATGRALQRRGQPVRKRPA